VDNTFQFGVGRFPQIQVILVFAEIILDQDHECFMTGMCPFWQLDNEKYQVLVLYRFELCIQIWKTLTVFFCSLGRSYDPFSALLHPLNTDFV
jgi:hypothetical protein